MKEPRKSSLLLISPYRLETDEIELIFDGLHVVELETDEEDD